MSLVPPTSSCPCRSPAFLPPTPFHPPNPLPSASWVPSPSLASAGSCVEHYTQWSDFSVCPSSGQSQRQTMARPSVPHCLSALPLLTWSRGCRCASLPLECQAAWLSGLPVPPSRHPPTPIPNPIPPHWSLVTMATASLSGRD